MSWGSVIIEIKTISDLQLLKEQGILRDRYIRAFETYFYELVEASDPSEGMENRALAPARLGF